MKKTSLLFLLQFIVAIAFGQTPKWETINGSDYSYKIVKGDPMKARFYTLKNGLTVILSENKEEPRVQTIIATKAGSKTDPSTNTGLAHYLEHMLFKGTDKYGSLDWEKEKPLLDKIDELYETYNKTKDEAKRKEIYAEIDKTSGEASKFAIANEYDKLMSMIGAKGTNAFTSFEQTAYINDIPTNQIGKWLTVEAERFRNPILRIFHTELEAVYEEKNRSLDSDDDKVFETLFAQLFKKHNYGQQTTIGTIEHLKNPSLKEIRKYFYKNYVPNNMCVILAGDFNADDMIVQIDNAFSFMKPSPVEPYTFSREDEITKPIEATVLGPDAEYLNLAFRFPGASTDEALMLDFMSSVLSNGNAGLMDLNLVKKQKVLSASAGAYALQDYSVLFIDGKAKEGQSLEEVKALLLDQIKLLKEGKFDDELLTAIINNYKKQLIQNQESNSGRAFTLLNSFTSNVDWTKNVAQISKMEKINKSMIQEFTKKWMNDNYVCIYKKIGKDPSTSKVDKPTITPVSVNREAESPFVTKISKTKANDIAPVFVDFDKDINKSSFKSGKNNIELLTVPNKTNELFSQYYYVNIGSYHNKLMPLAMDYLQYLGTKKYSAEDITKKLYTYASDFGVSASAEESYVFLNGLQKEYDNSVMLFEHLLENCIPNDEALKEMIAGEKKKRSDNKLNKNYIRSGMRYYAMYGKDNPFNYDLSEKELDNVTSAQLVEIIHSLLSYPHKVLYYGPSATIGASLSKMHKGGNTLKAIPVKKEFTYAKHDNSEVLFCNYDMVQSEIVWFRNNETFNVEKLPVINMFNEYFGGNMSGIVFQDIRESKALAYSASANYGTPSKKEDPFYVSAYVGCQADKMPESIDAMQALLTELPKSDKLFENSKNSILNSISTSRITKTAILFSYLNAQKKGMNEDSRKEVYNKVKGFSFDDINTFYNNEISKKPFTLSILANTEKVNWTPLKNYSRNIKILTLEEIFGY